MAVASYWLVAVGLLTGIFSGIFGIGGGVVLVPILVLALALPQATANGISLVALLLPVGSLGVYEYWRAGKIALPHIRAGLFIGLGIFLGTYLGSKVAVNLPTLILRRGFAVLLIGIAVRLWLA